MIELLADGAEEREFDGEPEEDAESEVVPTEPLRLLGSRTFPIVRVAGACDELTELVSNCDATAPILELAVTLLKADRDRPELEDPCKKEPEDVSELLIVASASEFEKVPKYGEAVKVDWGFDFVADSVGLGVKNLALRE